MAIVTQTIKNFIAGISQQPPLLRHPEQLEAQINGFSTEVGGLQKRPPTIHLGHLKDFPSSNTPKVHFIERDASEHYIVAIDGTQSNPELCIYNMIGSNLEKLPLTVSTPNGLTYLKCMNNRTQLKLVTIADYTFIVNTAITTKMSNTITNRPIANQGALVNVKSGQYGRTYRIRIDDKDIASYTTPDGSKAEHIGAITTDNIVNNLATAARNSGYAVTTGASWLYISKDNTVFHTVEAFDGFNNQAMFAFLDTVQLFNKLPVSAPNGYTVNITGEKKTSSDDYYVVYDANLGVWKETVKPGMKNNLNASTMPHVLIRQADGTFTFKEATWTPRKTGDEDSNPLPSFIDNTINDVFFFRNRLGFLSGENVILSNSSDFFDFWMTTATSVRDNDPIDIAVSDNKVSTLYQAVPFGADLVMFSKDTQFSLRSDDVLTPINSKVDAMTFFTSDPTVKPVGVGRNIYFTARRANYTSMKEYFTAFDDTDKRDAQDITAHIPNYIPNGVYSLVSSTVDNLILLLTQGAPNKMYVYKFLFIEGVRQQSSWSEWDFGNPVLGAAFMESTLYLIIKREDGLIYLEGLTITSDTKDFTSEPYRLYMDRKVEVNTASVATYDDSVNKTTIKLNTSYASNKLKGYYGVVTSNGVIYVKNMTENNPTIVVSGKIDSKNLIIGKLYNFKISFSTIYIKNLDNSGETQTTTDGRLQLQRLWVNFVNSGYFKVTVKEKQSGHKYIHTLYELDAGDKINEIILKSGIFKVPVQTQNVKAEIDLESTLPTPLALVGGGWDGRYVRKTRIV